MGKSFHACVFKCLGDQLHVFIGNVLISFYAKCGSMEDGLLVFNKLHGRNIVSWNALICGYAQNGRGKESIGFFERMLVIGFRPNHVTLLGLLWVCNHAGLVAEGYSYFDLGIMLVCWICSLGLGVSRKLRSLFTICLLNQVLVFGRHCLEAARFTQIWNWWNLQQEKSWH